MAPTPEVRALMAVARAKAADPVGSQDDVLKALTEWFGSPAAITATTVPDELLDRLVGLGIDRSAALIAGLKILTKPMTGRSRYGAPAPVPDMSAVRRVASEEPEMRAMFLLASARRLTEAKAEGTYVQGLKNEARWLDAHVAAGRNRRKAAARVDELGGDGQILVWRTAGDNRVDSVCRALEGRLFTADNPPGGMYPGAVHGRCRCHAASWGSPGAALFA